MTVMFEVKNKAAQEAYEIVQCLHKASYISSSEIHKYKFTKTLSLHFSSSKILPLLRSSSVWRVEREKLPLGQFKTYQGLVIYHAWLVAKVPPFLL